MANPTRWIHDSLTGLCFPKESVSTFKLCFVSQTGFGYRTIISFAFSVSCSQAKFPGSKVILPTSVVTFAPLRNFHPFHHCPPGDCSRLSGSASTGFSTRRGQETGTSQEKLDCGAIKVAVGSNVCMCKNPTL